MKIIGVIMTYNCEQFVQKAIDRIPKKYFDQLICTDDGSTDKTIEVVKKNSIELSTFLKENSEEFASDIPQTFLANSITAHCNPKQIPRKGILFSLMYCIADIFPSIPLYPKPPGTITPSMSASESNSKLSASIQ